MMPGGWCPHGYRRVGRTLVVIAGTMVVAGCGTTTKIYTEKPGPLQSGDGPPSWIAQNENINDYSGHVLARIHAKYDAADNGRLCDARPGVDLSDEAQSFIVGLTVMHESAPGLVYPNMADTDASVPVVSVNYDNQSRHSCSSVENADNVTPWFRLNMQPNHDVRIGSHTVFASTKTLRGEGFGDAVKAGAQIATATFGVPALSSAANGIIDEVVVAAERAHQVSSSVKEEYTKQVGWVFPSTSVDQSGAHGITIPVYAQEVSDSSGEAEGSERRIGDVHVSVKYAASALFPDRPVRPATVPKYRGLPIVELISPSQVSDLMGHAKIVVAPPGSDPSRALFTLENFLDHNPENLQQSDAEHSIQAIRRTNSEGEAAAVCSEIRKKYSGHVIQSNLMDSLLVAVAALYESPHYDADTPIRYANACLGQDEIELLKEANAIASTDATRNVARSIVGSMQRTAGRTLSADLRLRKESIALALQDTATEGFKVQILGGAPDSVIGRLEGLSVTGEPITIAEELSGVGVVDAGCFAGLQSGGLQHAMYVANDGQAEGGDNNELVAGVMKLEFSNDGRLYRMWLLDPNSQNLGEGWVRHQTETCDHPVVAQHRDLWAANTRLAMTDAR